MKPAERVSPTGVYVLEFPRFFAPFLEIGCCSNFEIRRGDVPILHDREFDPRGRSTLARSSKGSPGGPTTGFMISKTIFISIS